MLSSAAALAMFRWASPQPLPAALERLLERAGVSPCGPGERPDLRVFLPPHLLLQARSGGAGLPGGAYAGLEDDGSGVPLINGERLLGMEPAEIAHWLLGQHPPGRPLELAAVDPLLAAVTLAQLEQQPQLTRHYQRLDTRSTRGGAAADLDYGGRLQPTAAALLDSWQALDSLRRERDDSGAAARLQALGEALERELIEAQRCRDAARRQRRLNRRLLAERQGLRRLMRRLMGLQGRLLAAGGPRVRG